MQSPPGAAVRKVNVGDGLGAVDLSEELAYAALLHAWVHLRQDLLQRAAQLAALRQQVRRTQPVLPVNDRACSPQEGDFFPGKKRTLQKVSSTATAGSHVFCNRHIRQKESRGSRFPGRITALQRVAWCCAWCANYFSTRSVAKHRALARFGLHDTDRPRPARRAGLGLGRRNRRRALLAERALAFPHDSARPEREGAGAVEPLVACTSKAASWEHWAAA